MYMNNRNLIIILFACAVVIGIIPVLAAMQSHQNLQEQAASHQPSLVTKPNNISPALPPFSAPNDVTPPQLNITSPQGGTQLQGGSTVSLSAQASDNIAVSKVDFVVNGALLCTQTSAPYTCSWSVPSRPNTIYAIVVRAYDLTGNLS